MGTRSQSTNYAKNTDITRAGMTLKQMELPGVWNPLEIDGGHYLYGIRVNLELLNYQYVVTDLAQRYWIQSVTKADLIKALEANGIVGIAEDLRLKEFLQLLSGLVNEGTNVCTSEKMDSDHVLFKVVNPKLNWSFPTTLESGTENAVFLDRLLKFQLFNVVHLYGDLNEKLQHEIARKDRVIQVLSENLLELNNSFGSSMDEDNNGGNAKDIFKRRVEASRQFERLFPRSSNLRKSLFPFDRLSLHDDQLKANLGIWNRIESCTKDQKIWELSSSYDEVDRSQDTPSVSKTINSDFINLDELKSQKSAYSSVPMSPKRRKISAEEALLPSETGSQPLPQVRTPSPQKTRKFGVIGGDENDNGALTPSRKRKLKAGNSSPIKAPRIV